MTGLHISNCEYYARVKALLDQKINYVSYQDQRRQQTENEMLAKVRTAIQDLEGRNQPITATSVSEITCISPNSLIEYPRVKALLERRTNATRYSKSIMVSNRPRKGKPSYLSK